MNQRKRQYESGSDNDHNKYFYDDDHDSNESLSSEEHWDMDSEFETDIDDVLPDDQEDSRSFDFEGILVSNEDYVNFDSDLDSDSDDAESDFEADCTDYDDDWSWDEALDDPLATESAKTKELDEKVVWKDVKPTFLPRKEIPQCEVFADKDSTPTDLFFKMFPKKLIEWIVTCTNESLDMLAEKKGKEIPHTNEMTLVLGIFLVMAYNRVPHLEMYWSQHPSLENKTIKQAISRDRFLLLASKIYFNHPKKPANAGKTYYMDVLIKHLNKAFQRSRAESTHQSIDETMVKFKGRCSFKQYIRQCT